MTTDRYAALREALEAGPTQGRRKVRDDHPSRACIHIGVLGVYDEIASLFWAPGDYDREIKDRDGVTRGDNERVANAALIAACDPETIAALLKERDALRAIVEMADAVIEGAVTEFVRVPYGASHEDVAQINDWHRMAAETRSAMAALAAQER